MSKESYTPWDSAEFLNDDETIMEYLRVALEGNDLARFMKAFDNAARARFMNQKRIRSSWLAPTLSTSTYTQNHVIDSGNAIAPMGEAIVLLQGAAVVAGAQLVETVSIRSGPFPNSAECENRMAIEGK